MIKHKKAQWPWHGLTALVPVGLAFSLYLATSMISYEWRWNRVPNISPTRPKKRSAPLKTALSKTSPSRATPPA